MMVENDNAHVGLEEIWSESGAVCEISLIAKCFHSSDNVRRTCGGR